MKVIYSEALLASAPLIGLIVMLVFFRWTILQSSLSALILITVIAFYHFDLTIDIAFGSIIKASLITLDIAIILLGAIVFFKVMKLTGVMDVLQQKLLLLTPDHRLQIILIAWLLGGFIEGIAGFGTPAVVVAPLLISIGLPVFMSVILTLIANSTAVTFGAVGTPMRVGFDGLNIEGVAETASKINLIAGPVIPLIMLAMIVSVKKEKRLKSFIEAVPWTLWAGFAFTVPMWLFVKIGQEFGSLLGALTGLLLVGISVKFNFLAPGKPWKIDKASSSATNIAPFNAAIPYYIPYIFLIVTLITGKFLLKNLELNIALPGNLSYMIRLFNPGWFFLFTLLIICFIIKNTWNILITSFKESLSKAVKPVLAIGFIAVFVQVFINAGMLNQIAVNLKVSSLAFATPFLGAFGSFLTGSATVSNMLIAPILTSIDTNGINKILALQLLGAAAGNMIALQNILTISAAVDSKEKEGKILSHLLAPCIIYLFFILLISKLWPC